MKNAIVYIKDTSSLPIDDVKVIEDIFNSSVKFDRVEILPLDDDLSFKRQISYLKQTVDNLLVFVGEGVEFDYKSVIAEETERELLENPVPHPCEQGSGD